MNVIAFSLYGNIPKYVVGAIENAKLARMIYPGWRCIFYVNDTVPSQAILELVANDADVRSVSDRHPLQNGPLWRYLTADSENVWLIRDVDSRLNDREKSAVDEWLRSGKKYHIMRDHPHHIARIMAGMFGGRSPITGVLDKIMHWGLSNDLTSKFADQLFLSDVVYPAIKHDSLIHDAFHLHHDEDVRPYPTPYVDRFVGESIDEYGVPNYQHLQMRCSSR